MELFHASIFPFPIFIYDPPPKKIWVMISFFYSKYIVPFPYKRYKSKISYSLLLQLNYSQSPLRVTDLNYEYSKQICLQSLWFIGLLFRLQGDRNDNDINPKTLLILNDEFCHQILASCFSFT